MHHTRLSIFILPVLIIGLSIFTTFVEENPSFAKLFSISQVANPTAGEEGAESDDAQVEELIEEAEEIIEEQSEELPAENPDENIGEEVADDGSFGESEENQLPAEEPSEEVVLGGGGGGSGESETPQGEESEQTPNTEEETPVEIVEEVVEEEVLPPVDAELLAQKLAQFQVSKSVISSRFQQNLSKLENTRDELYAKIAQMEQEGKDVSRANDALAHLEDAIAQSKQYMRDSTQPDSIPGIQRFLGEYVKNIRSSIEEGYLSLIDVLKEVQ